MRVMVLKYSSLLVLIYFYPEGGKKIEESLPASQLSCIYIYIYVFQLNLGIK